MDFKQTVHEKIVGVSKRLCEWFRDKEKGLIIPIYSSYDIRDSGLKVATVDANVFPAGFNNICEVDRENSTEIAKKYFDKLYGAKVKKLALLTEEHTQNLYYWENVATLVKIFESTGLAIRVMIPRQFDQPLTIESATGKKITVYSAHRKGSGVEVDGYVPDLIISNNDFSDAYGEWSKGLTTPINPPREMGWYRRKKSDFFTEYNQVVAEFCGHLGLDPWFMQVETELFTHFDVSDTGKMDSLAQQVDALISRVRERYKDQGINDDPFVFIKNNSGTYGLGVIQVKSGEDVRALNYKSRKKMKAAKGGREITEVIIQEGIPTTLHSDGGSAEPAIYLIGCELAGGFLRAHSEKGPDESLNSPGAVFRRLCVSDLEIDLHGKPLENVYGWIAKLGLLAIGREYQKYQKLAL